MRDNVLWRKESRIIMALAAALSIDAERALDVYYSTQTARQLTDPKYGLQLMSDGYIVENILAELRGQTAASFSAGSATDASDASTGQKDRVLF